MFAYMQYSANMRVKDRSRIQPDVGYSESAAAKDISHRPNPIFFAVFTIDHTYPYRYYNSWQLKSSFETSV